MARVLALLLVAFGVWRVLAWKHDALAPVRVDAPIRDAFARLTAMDVAAMHLPLASTPDAVERDWLVALRRAGTTVTWSDAGLAPPAAISLTRMADPAGGIAVAVASSGEGTISITDTLGLVDSVSAGALGARITAPSVQGSVTARQGSAAIARGQPPVPRVLRPLLVTGSAGWETKFIIAALEERGWAVHSRIRVSPTATVTQGRQARLDTASYSAAIVLDSAGAPPSAALVSYVRQGGGLVLAGNAARASALAAIAPARYGTPVAGSLLRSASATGREGLPMLPLADLRVDAVALDERDGRTIAAARREGAGRVALVGETESWRWRMARGAHGPAEHRRWWAGIVSSVAHAPLAAIPVSDPESAPYAALVDALGGSVQAPATTPGLPSPALPPWLGASILGLLLFEWASRRLRGER